MLFALVFMVLGALVALAVISSQRKRLRSSGDDGTGSDHSAFMFGDSGSSHDSGSDCDSGSDSGCDGGGGDGGGGGGGD